MCPEINFKHVTRVLYLEVSFENVPVKINGEQEDECNEHLILGVFSCLVFSDNL